MDENGDNFWSGGMPVDLVGVDTVDGDDWRAALQAESREKIANKIMETIKRHLLFSGQEGLQDLKQIAVLFEEKIYSAASSQSDYWHEISSKMLTMESKSQNSVPSSLPSSLAGTVDKPPDPGASSSIQPQWQWLPANQAQQQLLSQNMQSTITSATLPSLFPPVSGMNQTPINVVGQNANNMPDVAPNLDGSTLMAEGVPSNMFGNAEQLLMQFQQQLIQLQQQLLMQSQLQQQSVMQMTQLQPAKQSCMQASSSLQSASSSISGLMQNQRAFPGQSIPQQQYLLQRQQQYLLQQQQRQLRQQLELQQLLVPQSNFSGLLQQMPQQNLLGTQSSNSSMQSNVSGNHPQQVGSLPCQYQRMPQQRLLETQSGNSSMQSNLSSTYPQQSVPQSSLPQNLLLGTQSGNSSMQNNHSDNYQHQWVPQSNFSSLQQQMVQQNMTNSLKPSLHLQSNFTNMVQHRRQMRRQIVQKRKRQRLHQEFLEKQGLQQQQLAWLGTLSSNSSMQSNLTASLDSTAQTGHANGGDWQEEIYQKIQTMKEMYLPELNEMHQEILTKLQQYDADAPPWEPKTDQVEQLKMNVLDGLMAFLQVSKDNVLISFKEELASYESQIITCLNENRHRKRMRQLPSSDMQSLLLPTQQMPQQDQFDDVYEVKPDVNSLLLPTKQMPQQDQFDDVYEVKPDLNSLLLPTRQMPHQHQLDDDYEVKPDISSL